jgi:DNA repair exonuclease SbcCD nuclease subunit
MPRFLHTADWQIGRRYSQFDPDDASLLAEARALVVEKLAALAIDRAVDAVLVAGDVFDAQTVSDRVIRRLFAAMSGFAGPWVMIPGNHDAALSESVWTRAQRLGAVPANVHLALTPGVISLEPCKTAVLCAPLTQRHTYSDTTEAFDGIQTPDGWLRIGLAHGSVEGILPGEIDSANPIASNRCLSARLEYLALGDWHGLKIVNERCAYSGTPEQERFRDNEPGYCIVVDVEGPGAVPKLEPVCVGRHQWSDLALSVAVPTDIDQICVRLASLRGDDVVQVAISGRTDLSGHRRLTEALGRAEAAVRSLRHDLADLRLLPTKDDIAALHADGYLAEVIAELRDEQGDGRDAEQARVAREALAILCSALDPAVTSGAAGGTTA